MPRCFAWLNAIAVDEPQMAGVATTMYRSLIPLWEGAVQVITLREAAVRALRRMDRNVRRVAFMLSTPVILHFSLPRVFWSLFCIFTAASDFG